jgi:hypothetical protein
VGRGGDDGGPHRTRDLHRLRRTKKHESLSGEKADISNNVGGTFTAWGNHLSGFNLVLQTGEKIVQAWRAHDWWPDHYSIVNLSSEN